MNAPSKPPSADDQITTVSTKGQVVLPKSVRERLGWKVGDKLTVEETPGGVLLRREPKRPATRLDDVIGILKWSGPYYTMEEVRSGIGTAMRERWGGVQDVRSADGDDDEKTAS